ncbi:hypothetical protein HJC23_004184 [Cyclotella cryptica]|eukprot:CCRYP_007820-RA/>CCRYP_007820-RA protein AED:0.00 eAED:0.00 QI:15/-1/1/1/-1/1/1/142/488
MTMSRHGDGVNGNRSSDALRSLDEFDKAVQSNNLQSIVNYLETQDISSLTDAQLQSIFDAIEIATAESDANTVNTRLLEEAKAVEFRSLDRVRAQMTKLYLLLREGGRLQAFGAIARQAPKSSRFSSENPPGPIYPAAGSKIVTPTILEDISGMEMINLTPQPTNMLLYGGAALAVLEGVISLYFHINFNLLVAFTLLLAVADQVLVSGAVFETALRMVLPEMTTRITKHEAGHFLCAYLLGCPVEGVVLSTWAALQDGRFGGRSTRAVSAGTSYYDLDMSEQISGLKPLTRDSIDRYSIIVMGGIAAEALEFGRADGGAGDEEALVRFLRSLNPRSNNSVKAWTPELIRNQARWGATQAVLLLKEYKPCYDALVDALERGGDLGSCVVAIENAAKREGLGWLRKPLGTILEDGEFGKWVVGYENPDVIRNGESDVVGTTNGSTNGVPTYGEDPITSTEEFLQKYREQMEKKLQSIDEQLAELDSKPK